MSSRRFAFQWRDYYPCLTDKTKTLTFDRHYIYHPAWAARILADSQPIIHIDVSSTLLFASLISARVPTVHYDYRPPNLRLDNLSVACANMLSLPLSDASVVSLSSMHVIEHIGLGRYGESLDPDGDLKAVAELKRVLAPGGTLLLVVPIGKPKIMFNAHRIYSYDQVITMFTDLALREFSLIPDNPGSGGIVKNPPDEIVDSQQYGCGCFWFKRQ